MFELNNLFDWVKLVVLPVLLFFFSLEAWKYKFSSRVTKDTLNSAMKKAADDALLSFITSRNQLLAELSADLKKAKRERDDALAAMSREIGKIRSEFLAAKQSLEEQITELRLDHECLDWSVKQEEAEAAIRIQTRAKDRRGKVKA